MKKFEIVKHLSTLIQCEKLIITGSLALELHGFKVEKNDIDLILVNPAEASVEMLKRLAEESPTPYGHRYPDALPISFIFEETYIDIFIEDMDVEDTSLKAHGFYIAKIDRIVKAKMEHNRDKDWVSLMRLGRQIFNPNKFNQFLDKPPIKSFNSDDFHDSKMDMAKKKSKKT